MFVPGKAGIMFSVTEIDAVRTKQGKAQIYEEVEINEDNCFDETTGVFTAPYAGAYIFSARAKSNQRGVKVSSHIMIGKKRHALVQGGHYGKSICSLVHLKQYQKVWMKADSPADEYSENWSGNSFYCFLVQADP